MGYGHDRVVERCRVGHAVVDGHGRRIEFVVFRHGDRIEKRHWNARFSCGFQSIIPVFGIGFVHVDSCDDNEVGLALHHVTHALLRGGLRVHSA